MTDATTLPIPDAHAEMARAKTGFLRDRLAVFLAVKDGARRTNLNEAIRLNTEITNHLAQLAAEEAARAPANGAA